MPDLTHSDFAAQLDAYLDDELTANDAHELESHIAQCPECTRLRDGRAAVRAAIVARLPWLHAPAALRTRVRASLRAAVPKRTPRLTGVRRQTVWRALGFATVLGIVALGGWTLALQRGRDETLANELLASHLRSLMPGHLTDVRSANLHTVKPWFNGKVDFSPPVYDFAPLGYPLLGGRLDYVEGRTVAALVYGRRQHVINVFLSPAARGSGAVTTSRSGYHLLHWTDASFSYWVVSDLALGELRGFVALLKQADAAAQPHDYR